MAVLGLVMDLFEVHLARIIKDTGPQYTLLDDARAFMEVFVRGTSYFIEKFLMTEEPDSDLRCEEVTIRAYEAAINDKTRCISFTTELQGDFQGDGCQP